MLNRFIQLLFIYTFSLLLSCCSIPSYRIQSSVQDTLATMAKSIAIPYTQYSTVAIANQATNVLMKELSSCKNLKLIKPDSIEEILYKNKITMPARMTKGALDDLHKSLGDSYLLVSQLGDWREAEFNLKRGARVSLTILLYNLKEKKLIWSCTGTAESTITDGPIQGANYASTEMSSLLKKQFSKWPRFCKN